MSNNYVLLETIALTQSAASVTFDNIPQTGYTDLKIVVSARLASGTGFMLLDFNGLSTANFSHRVLEGNGASAYSFVSGNTNYATGLVGGGDTANTFTNVEFYIPNYAGSTFKSVSIDGVTENNGTTAYADLEALLWSNTAAISQFKLTTSSAVNFAVGSTFSLYGVAALGTTPVLAPKATGGNIVANDGTYWYHAFTSSGNFVPQTGLTADLLVVAGGGGSGYFGGSGGGAGGLLYQTGRTLTFGNTFSCTIGAGGAGGTTDGTNGVNGSNSVFDTSTALGGGAGTNSASGFAGGSGGGAGHSNNTVGGAATQGNSGGATGYGNAGGNNTVNAGPPNYPMGGGGGAGAVGQNVQSSSVGGAGGNGLSGLTIAALNAFGAATLTGQLSSGNYYYAGGGGGNPSGAGGLGGGGTASAGNRPAGTANTGGGAGGGGGTGGSGIIIIRYPIA